MNKKLSAFPDDDTGDALRRLQKDGDDLTKARGIDFTVVFPTANAAEQFAEHFRHLGHKATVENSNCVSELPWDVIVVHCIVLSHAEITAFEESLQTVAVTFGGRNDGWGCFAVNNKSGE
jgi:hypothetical protein